MLIYLIISVLYRYLMFINEKYCIKYLHNMQ
jgi:hypothetical protein